MLYHLPLKQQVESKWLTATLLAIYLLVTAFLFLNSPQNEGTKGETSFQNIFSQSQDLSTAAVN